jgi:hypothetical protein
VKIPNADKIIFEDLLTKSLDVILQGLRKMNALSGGGSQQGTLDHMMSERDFINILNTMEFCIKQGNFPSVSKLKGIMDQLLMEYEHSAYKFKHETQEQFIKNAKEIYRNDLRKWEKVAEISIKYVKTEATSLKYLCNGLEVFEALDIVKHESRRLLLGKIKNIIDKNEFKIWDLLYLMSLYPNKIRTRAFEQLIELALSKIITNNLLPNVD